MPGDYVIKPDYNDPDLAVVLEVSNDDDRDITVSFHKHLEQEFGEQIDIPPADLSSRCDEAGIISYSYKHDELNFKHQY